MDDEHFIQLSFMSSYVILLEHVGNCRNEFDAPCYGFIDITLEVLILSFDTLITQDLAYN